MSAYSDWKCGAITDDQYKSAMRRECGDSLPFYTDDADDPHWRCENCAHCKSFNARRPIISFKNWVDDKGYVHNNPDKPTPQNLYARWSVKEEYIPANLCELTRNQVMDDDYCEDFEEREE